jgi:hypothetical protein
MDVTDRIVGFLDGIGMPCRSESLQDETFLPGIVVQDGCLVYDPARLLYPGDLLHEAGHLAIMAPERRTRAKPNVGKYAAEEMAAIAWSYAAVVHLELDPTVLFHENGYRGQSASLVHMYTTQPLPPGVPILQWLGMTTGYPVMTRWLNDGSNAAATETFK